MLAFMTLLVYILKAFFIESKWSHDQTNLRHFAFLLPVPTSLFLLLSFIPLHFFTIVSKCPIIVFTSTYDLSISPYWTFTISPPCALTHQYKAFYNKHQLLLVLRGICTTIHYTAALHKRKNHRTKQECPFFNPSRVAKCIIAICPSSLWYMNASNYTADRLLNGLYGAMM